MINISKFEKICVLTGAGISAESGVPTFRGGGQSAVWKGMPFEVISSAGMVKSNLAEVWEWFDYRRGVLSKCEPNSAHFALARIEAAAAEFLLVTQNIDGLHDRAGSKNIVEIHGNINRARCVDCGERVNLEADTVPHQPKKCPSCENELRPDVVLFGEMLPEGAFETGSVAAARCDLFLVIGTSALVYPAAMLPEIAVQNGAVLVEINPEETPLTPYCDESYRGTACEYVPLLLESE